jgi:hypothetical protein
MDDLWEILGLPLEVYAEYWAGARYLARETPLFTAVYVAAAVSAAILLIRWLRSRPITFRRAYLCCLALSLLVLPGAFARGGLSIVPLVVVLGVCVIQPIWLLYNFTLLAIAALAAWLAARLVVRSAAGKAPAAERGVDVKRP